MSWASAVIRATIITALLIIFLGFLPSIFRYEWEARMDSMAQFVADRTGFEFEETYTLVRIHDAISMGVQTVIFAIPIAATYILGERRRRRLGLRGTEGVKGYLPGK
jgi:hypothetical protein